MPREFSDYGRDDWRRLLPIEDRYQTWRVRQITQVYTRLPARAGNLPGLRAALLGQRVMLTIAFNDPEILRRQILAVRAFVPEPVHVVADNSSNNLMAGEISALCANLGVPYLRLPPNPFGRGAPSRSHGAALNWVWRRLLKPARPEAFGFIDHDLLPLEHDDPFEALARQPVAGDKRWAGDRWYLWAGYCFFRYNFVEGLALDFGQDWPLRLDTGGANWELIYSRLDPETIDQRPVETVPLFPNEARESFFERRGKWLHEVGWSGDWELKPAKRARILALIDEALARSTSDTMKGHMSAPSEVVR